ncbi:MAG: Hsp20 family protein [Candidatus Dormibacter sp.]
MARKARERKGRTKKHEVSGRARREGPIERIHQAEHMIEAGAARVASNVENRFLAAADVATATGSTEVNQAATIGAAIDSLEDEPNGRQVEQAILIDFSSPPINFYESNGRLAAAIPLPGAHRDTIHLTLTPQRLTLVAEPRYPEEEEHYLQQQWLAKRFSCSCRLPRAVRPTEAEAILSDGILRVDAPIGEVTGSRRVSVPVTELRY